MRITLSKHAKKRAQQRKIAPAWIEETIKQPDILTREQQKYYARKKHNGLTLEVIYVKERDIKVVTLYPI